MAKNLHWVELVKIVSIESYGARTILVMGCYYGYISLFNVVVEV
jgi:hypothetical protein